MTWWRKKKNPLELYEAFVQASRAYYDSVEGVECDEVIHVPLVLDLYLYASLRAAKHEYKRVTGREWKGWLGVFLPKCAARPVRQVWARFKRLPNGNELPDLFVLGHEIAHAIDRTLERDLDDPEGASNPDAMATEDFYGRHG